MYMIDTTGPGGAETLFIDLCKKFISHTHNGLAVIHGSGWVENKLIENNIPHLILHGKGSFNIKYLFQLLKLVKTHKINIIHSHLFGSNIYASLVGILSNTPVISTFHGLVDIKPDERFLTQKISILRKGSKIIAVSQKINDYLTSETQLTPRDIQIIPNGIHLRKSIPDKTADLRKQYGISETSTIIGCLGNVRPAKDYETAINTIKILNNSDIDVNLLIAGATNHELYEHYLDLIKKHDLHGSIKFIGFIQDPYYFLSNIDIYMMTSTTEGQPISLFQAMSSSLPIVGTKCGIEDVLEDGQTAWLSPVQSPESLANSIIEIINNPHENVRRSENARRYVSSNYDIETMFKHYSLLYKELTQK